VSGGSRSLSTRPQGNRTAGRLRRVHCVLSVAVAITVPAVIYLVNGEFESWTLVLGLAIGVMYWYFGPLLLPF
jgi:hypothetical protein